MPNRGIHQESQRGGEIDIYSEPQLYCFSILACSTGVDDVDVDPTDLVRDFGLGTTRAIRGVPVFRVGC